MKNNDKFFVAVAALAVIITLYLLFFHGVKAMGIFTGGLFVGETIGRFNTDSLHIRHYSE